MACTASRTFNTGGASFLKLAACHFNDAQIGAFDARSVDYLLTLWVAVRCPFHAGGQLTKPHRSYD